MSLLPPSFPSPLDSLLIKLWRTHGQPQNDKKKLGGALGKDKF